MTPIESIEQARHHIEVSHRLIHKGAPREALNLLGPVASFLKLEGEPADRAWCAFRQAQAYAALGEHMPSSSLYLTAQQEFEQAGLLTNAATCMLNRANQLDSVGQHQQAYSIYVAAQEIFLEQRDGEGVALCAKNLATCCLNMNDRDGALELLELAAYTYRLLDQPEQVRDCELRQQAIRVSGHASSNTSVADRRIEKTIARAEKLYQKAVSAHGKGSHAQAKRAIERALSTLDGESLQNTSQWWDLRVAQINITAVTDPGHALTDLESLLNNKAIRSHYRQTAKAHLTAGQLLDQTGLPQRAVDHLQSAIDLLRARQESIDRRYLAATYHSYGVVLARCAHYEPAIEQLERACDLFRDLNEQDGLLAAESALANARADAGVSSALDDLERSTMALETSGDADHSLAGRLNLAAKAAARGDTERALTLAATCGEALRRVDNVGLRIQGHGLLAEVYAKLSDGAAHAHQHAQSALSYIEDYRRSLRSDRDRLMYLANASVADIYARAVALAWEASQPADAFHTHESYRNYALLAQLSDRAAEVTEGVPVDLREQIGDLRDRHAQLLDALYKAEGGGDQQAVERMLHQLGENSEGIRHLEAEARSANSRYQLSAPPLPVDIEDIQTKLDPRTALLKFAVLPDRILGWALTADTVATFEIAEPETVIGLVRDYVRLLDQPYLYHRDGGIYSPRPELVRQQRELAHALYTHLVAPLLSLVNAESVDRMVIAPDGFLNHLPFETLLTAPPIDNQEIPPFLLQHYAVSYTPSLTVFDALEFGPGVSPQHDCNVKPWIGFGNPQYGDLDVQVFRVEGGQREATERVSIPVLPCTEQEVRRIADILSLPPEGKHLNVGPTANSVRVRRIGLEDYQTIHFACHCYLPESANWINEPALVLSFVRSGQGMVDPLLRYSDIKELDLHADLIVLSACNTAFGPNFRGEGLLGLARAFFYAGAMSVVASFWTVADESTALLMETFYQHLRLGEHIDEALRQAKLELIERAAPEKEMANSDIAVCYLDPFFWAPFISLGSRHAPTGLVRGEISDG